MEIKPVAWLHEIQEPAKSTLRLLSHVADNPWSHWVDEHKDQCAYCSTALYDSTALEAARAEERERIISLIDDHEGAPDSYYSRLIKETANAPRRP